MSRLSPRNAASEPTKLGGFAGGTYKYMHHGSQHVWGNADWRGLQCAASQDGYVSVPSDGEGLRGQCRVHHLLGRIRGGSSDGEARVSLPVPP